MIKPIQLINPLRQLKPASFKGNLNIESKPDTYEKSDEAKLNEAIKKAKETILEHMTKDGKEYGFLLSSSGEILDEKQGDESSCRLDLSKAKGNCYTIHGHSDKCPLSPNDVALFLTSTGLNEMEAISPDGQSSKLTKTPFTPTDFEYYEVLEKTARRYCLNILDGLGIEYKDDENGLISLGKQCLENIYVGTEIKDQDVIPKLKEMGIYKDGDLKTSYKNLYSMLSIHNVNVYDDRAEEVIDKNKDLIERETYTPLGIKAANDALEQIAAEYNLIYKSDVE